MRLVSFAMLDSEIGNKDVFVFLESIASYALECQDEPGRPKPSILAISAAVMYTNMARKLKSHLNGNTENGIHNKHNEWYHNK